MLYRTLVTFDRAPADDSDREQAEEGVADELRQLGWPGRPRIHFYEARRRNGPMHLFGEVGVATWRVLRARLYWAVRRWLHSEEVQRAFGVRDRLMRRAA